MASGRPEAVTTSRLARFDALFTEHQRHVLAYAIMTWLQTEEGAALRDRPEALATASPDELRKLLTAIIRSDRFVEGSIVGAFESGLLARIARRASALLLEAQA